jgi:hypothetical protein
MVALVMAWYCWPSKVPVYKGMRVEEYIQGFHDITVLPFLNSRVRQVTISGPATVSSSVSVVLWSEIPFDADTDAAFRIFGTNALPYLRAAMRARNTRDLRTLAWLATHIPWLRIRPRSIDDEHMNALRIYSRILDKDYWRDSRAACEPEVRALMDDPNPSTRRFAAFVYRQINPLEYP